MTTAEEYRAEVASDKFDVATPRDGATFYSNDAERGGPHRNRDRADVLIKEGDGRYARIETTPGGRWLNDEQLYKKLPQEQADAVWSEASKKYANEASGDAKTCVVGARPSSVFRRDELPVLVDNEKVTSVNGIPREELKQLHAKDPEAAFNKVCEAEIAQARTAAETGGDKRALDDTAARQQLYDKQVLQQGRTQENATDANPPEREKMGPPDKNQHQVDEYMKHKKEAEAYASGDTWSDRKGIDERNQALERERHDLEQNPETAEKLKATEEREQARQQREAERAKELQGPHHHH